LIWLDNKRLKHSKTDIAIENSGKMFIWKQSASEETTIERMK
jgi:hypothetical protein